MQKRSHDRLRDRAGVAAIARELRYATGLSGSLAARVRLTARVLTPGGTLVLSVPNKWWIFETHGARLPLLPWNRVPFFSWLPRPIHGRFARARIYTRGRILRLLAEAGFEILACRYLTAPMDVVRQEGLAALLRRTIFSGPGTRWPILSTSIFVMARRP